MLIDWFTVVAQALNFLVLVWLLRRVLYKPILHAIDEREKRIAKELADAAAKQSQAQQDRDAFQRKNDDLDQQRAALLTRATNEAHLARERLMDEAQQAAAALATRRQRALEDDARTLNQAIRRRTQKEVFAITRKALTDLATTSLEERLGDVFTRRLRGMDGKARATFASALETAPEPAVVRSAFDLPGEQRALVQNALDETFPTHVKVRFETAPELISGIEITANGQCVAWSLADYLAVLEKNVEELLTKTGRTVIPPLSIPEKVFPAQRTPEHGP